MFLFLTIINLKLCKFIRYSEIRDNKNMLYGRVFFDYLMETWSFFLVLECENIFVFSFPCLVIFYDSCFYPFQFKTHNATTVPCSRLASIVENIARDEVEGANTHVGFSDIRISQFIFKIPNRAERMYLVLPSYGK